MANHGSVRSPRQGYAPTPLVMKSNNRGLIMIGAVILIVIGGIVALLFSFSGRDRTPALTLAPLGAATTLLADGATMRCPIFVPHPNVPQQAASTKAAAG